MEGEYVYLGDKGSSFETTGGFLIGHTYLVRRRSDYYSISDGECHFSICDILESNTISPLYEESYKIFTEQFILLSEWREKELSKILDN